MTWDKYYTAFVYEGKRLGDLQYPDVDQFHCTHKYLADVGTFRLDQIFSIIDGFFANEKRVFPHAHFGQEEHFGSPPNLVRVLTPIWLKGNWFPTLREELDRFRKDDYHPYRPHVSCARGVKAVTEEFFGYALINSTRKKIEYFWRNEK